MVARKPLDQQVVVITGAAGRIGRSTAESATRSGAKLVLVASDRQALEDIVEQINDSGGDAIAVACDCDDHRHVDRVTRIAIERFGKIDTWVTTPSGN